jgi:hypothetical protein
MSTKINAVMICAGLLLMLSAQPAAAIKGLGGRAGGRSISSDALRELPSSGSGEGMIFSLPSIGESRSRGPNPMPPGDTVGCTYWDYFQNGSMGRMISWDGQAGSQVHFLWTDRATAGGPHYIHKNDRANAGTGVWANGSGLYGGLAQSASNGGYSELSVNLGNGYGVASWHRGPTSALFQSYAGQQVGSQIGSYAVYVCPGPPAPYYWIDCEEIQTGNYEGESSYIWPKVAWQSVAGPSEVIHVVSQESPPGGAPVGEVQTIVYYRWQDGRLDLDGDGIAEVTDSCGRFIDTTYTDNVIVVADPNSDKVAIVYLKPMYYDTLDTRLDGCTNTQMENDVVCIESSNGGITWGPMVNVTDYSSGGYLHHNQMEYMAWADVTALYDNDGILHIVWPTPRFDIDNPEPCFVTFQSMLWHWSSQWAPEQNISAVFDGTNPQFVCTNQFGAFEWSLAKPILSLCPVGGNDVLYVSFTRFGAHVDHNDPEVVGECSDDGLGLGDVFVTASSDGGMTWGPDGSLPLYDPLTNAGMGRYVGPVKEGTAVNVTNTWTDSVTACAAPNCHNEHWASMPQYCVDNLHIFYEDDNDAGAAVRGDEGEETNNAMMYYKLACFAPEPVFDYSYTPDSGFVAIAPGNSVPSDQCNIGKIDTFYVIIRNKGNVPINYNAADNLPMVMPFQSSGQITPGVGFVDTLTYLVGPYYTPGQYVGTISLSLTSMAGSGNFTIPVVVDVTCKYFPPECKLLSTFCWSAGIWNVPRTGTQLNHNGNMQWYEPYDDDTISPMYDAGLVISRDNDTTQTWFSIFDGSFSNAGFAGLDSVTTYFASTYEYAHGEWADPVDSCIVGEIDYYVPLHPDTCVLVERVRICNECTGTIVLNIGEGADWDIEDGDTNGLTWRNRSGRDSERNIVYQYGTYESWPSYEDCAAGVSYCHSNPGAMVLENDQWVYPNAGYNPAKIGGLIARHQGLSVSDPDSIEDLSTMSIVAQNLTLTPGACYTFCGVKASTIYGVSDLLSLIDKGKHWIVANGLDCPGCEFELCCDDPGNVNGSSAEPVVDIDDIVYLINFLCAGGPPPPYEAACCGNVDGDCDTDYWDVIYITRYIFLGGPAPTLSPCSDPPTYQDPGEPDVLKIGDGNTIVNIGSRFHIPVTITNDQRISAINLKRMYLEYEGGAGLLTCDSVTYWGTDLEDELILPNRVFGATDFGSISGGYVTLSMSTYYWTDTLGSFAGTVANIWFTAVAEGSASIALTHEEPLVFLPIEAIGGLNYWIEPLLDLGAITILGEYSVSPDESTTDPVFVATPSGSHPFVVTLRNSFGDPIEGSSDVSVQIINYSKALVLCPTQTQFPVLTPIAPSDANGKVAFYLAAGNCDANCEAVVSCSAGEIARVPVRSVDKTGDLYVDPVADKPTDATCGDFDGDGYLDSHDQDIFHLYDWQLCGDPCSAYRMRLSYIPEDSLTPGVQLDTILLVFENTTASACTVTTATVSTTEFGFGGGITDSWSFQDDRIVQPGRSTTYRIVNWTIPVGGLGCLLADITVAGCQSTLHTEICPQIFYECNPNRPGLCYNFGIYFTQSGYLFTEPPIDLPPGFIITQEPPQGFYSMGSQLLLQICHTEVAVTQDSVVYRYYLSTDGQLSSDDDRYVCKVAIRANNGDVTEDCFVDIDDIVFLINYVFAGGPTPIPVQLGDVDCSIDIPIDIDDIVYLINYIFAGGPQPVLCPE